jgi:iron uptake system component EfeO
VRGGRAGTLGAVATAVLLAACSSSGSTDSDSTGPGTEGAGDPDAIPVIALKVDIDSCGTAWTAAHGGEVRFAVTNGFYNPMEAYLTDAGTGAYVAEYEGIGTDATLVQTVTLGNGSYRFVCFPEDEAAVTGPTVTISDASGIVGTPEVAPVSTADLIAPSQAYKRWIASRLPVLRSQTAMLAADVGSGATTKARADWLTAHLTYATLGAAYDAFSSGDTDFDGLIDPSPTAGVDPATDEELTGFHRLEALLWTDAPASSLVPVADALVSDVGKLVGAFPQLDIEPNDLPLRAHEIVENAIQFELTGATDAGSQSNLATAWANLTGAQHALVELDPLLRERYPGLATTDAALASTKELLVSLTRGGRPDRGWPALSTLSDYRRARVNGAFQHTVELLAPIAAICDVRSVVQP